MADNMVKLSIKKVMHCLKSPPVVRNQGDLELLISG